MQSRAQTAQQPKPIPLPTPTQSVGDRMYQQVITSSPLLSTSGASAVDRIYNTFSGQAPTTLGDALSGNITQTLQPLANVLTIIQSSTFWLNVGGLAIGMVILFLAVQALMKQELLSTFKKEL